MTFPIALLGDHSLYGGLEDLQPRPTDDDLSFDALLKELDKCVEEDEEDPGLFIISNSVQLSRFWSLTSTGSSKGSTLCRHKETGKSFLRLIFEY